MDSNLKKLLLAGIGAAYYSYEKAESLLDELVKKGELTFLNGKELKDELKRKLGTDKNKVSDSCTLSVSDLKEMLENLNLATKQDIDALNERINKLESK